VISIITVCHNSSDALADYVDSFLLHHGRRTRAFDCEFVFVENSGDLATRGQLARLTAADYSGRLIESQNRGFGAACNLGARESTGSLCLFVNPDVEFASPLNPLSEHDGKAVWGGVLQLDREGREQSVDRLPEHKGVLYELTGGHRRANASFPRKWRGCYVVGSGLAVSKQTFLEVGGFNEAIFLYYEDAELCRRLVQRGLPFLERRVVIRHSGFGSQREDETSFRHEAAGFVAYCRITKQDRLIESRLHWARLLAPISRSARLSYLALKRTPKPSVGIVDAED
jgi:GT2 family glycosyltransferase